jgi:hypothetical protein
MKKGGGHEQMARDRAAQDAWIKETTDRIVDASTRGETTRWAIVAEPQCRRIGKTWLLQQLVKRFVAMGYAAAVLTTCRRTFLGKFKDTGAAYFPDGGFMDPTRVYVVDDADHVDPNQLGLIQRRVADDDIYIETRIDCSAREEWEAFPRLVVHMPRFVLPYNDYFPDEDDAWLEHFTAKTKEVFAQDDGD